MLSFDTVLQTFQNGFLGSIISVKDNRRDYKIYGKPNDKQYQQKGTLRRLGKQVNLVRSLIFRTYNICSA